MEYHFSYWKDWHGLSKADTLTEGYCFILWVPKHNEMVLQNCFQKIGLGPDLCVVTPLEEQHRTTQKSNFTHCEASAIISP